MQLLVNHDILDEAVVIRLEGEIDSSNSDEFASHLAAAAGMAAGHPGHLLVVDLQQISFFGSAGLNAVLDCHEKAAGNGTAIRLLASHPEVVCPIQVTKLDTILSLYSSLADAVGAQPPP